MEAPIHTLPALFKQLGLPHAPRDIEHFVTAHTPLPPRIALAEAPFWSPAQAAFLREEILEDADWVSVIDELNTLLRRG